MQTVHHVSHIVRWRAWLQTFSSLFGSWHKVARMHLVRCLCKTPTQDPYERFADYKDFSPAVYREIYDILIGRVR
jgi:hypothetical protein